MTRVHCGRSGCLESSNPVCRPAPAAARLSGERSRRGRDACVHRKGSGNPLSVWCDLAGPGERGGGEPTCERWPDTALADGGFREVGGGERGLREKIEEVAVYCGAGGFHEVERE